MPKFRKKPVEIEAVKWQGSTVRSFDKLLDVPDWWSVAMQDGRIGAMPNGNLIVKTSEGEMTAKVGDWIIRGVEGELYPCKPSISPPPTMPFDDQTDFERALAEQPELTPEQRHAQEKALRDTLDLARAYNRTFTGIDGEMVLRDLRNTFHERTSLDKDPNVTQANEGKRFVVLYILAKMELADASRSTTES